MRRFALAAAFALTLCADESLCDVQARVRDSQGNYHNVFASPLASGATVVLNTASLAQAAGRVDFDVVWLFDTASEFSTPSSNIGPVTLAVGLDSQSNPVIPREIRLIVARPPSAANPNPQPTGTDGDFGGEPIDPFPFPGALNFRSLTVAPELLPTTRVVIAVSGDVGIDPALNSGIRDVIEAGQVYRIQANGRTELVNNEPTFLGGDIHARIVATGEDEYIHGTPAILSQVFPSGVGSGFDTLAEVRAGNSIRGPIEAVYASRGGSGPNERSTIGRVIVGPNIRSDSPGLVGDILAEGEPNNGSGSGLIRVVYCAGPIGLPPPAAPVSIRARDTIREVRTLQEGPNGLTVVNSGINAAIYSGVNVDPFDSQTTAGILGCVEAGGNISGSIFGFSLANLGAPRDPGTGGGIYSLGQIDAPITIARDAIGVGIVGGSITAPVRIGGQFAGMILAFGRDTVGNTGEMASVQIGRGIDDNSDGQPDHLLVATRGFTPVVPFIPSNVPIAPPPVPPANDDHPLAWFLVPVVESLIRAEQRIGSIDISVMTQSAGLRGRDRPRIEAPRIDHLLMGPVVSGVVWSGKLSFPGGVPTVAPGDRYASIGTAQVDCVAPLADLWFQDCPNFVIKGNLSGEVHVPHLTTEQQILLERGLSDWTLIQCLCGTDESEPSGPPQSQCFFWPIELVEQTPRGVPSWFVEFDAGEPAFGAARRGAIAVGEPFSLEGQIIIDGTNQSGLRFPETRWKGDVWIGADDPFTAIPVNTSIDRPAAFRAPLYESPHAAFGGGAIGLVPFARHPVDDRPQPPDPSQPSSPTNAGVRPIAAFFASDHSGDVLIDFYGPQRDRDPIDGLLPIVVEVDMPLGWIDVSDFFAVELGLHTLRLRPASSSLLFDFPVGLFRVSPRSTPFDGPQLLCAGLPMAPEIVAPVDWNTEPFHFWLFPDCNSNGEIDPGELRADRTEDCGPNGFGNGIADLCDVLADPSLDLNNDGQIDTCPGNCPVDVDANGTLDPDDLADYIACYFAAPPCSAADFDNNGAVDPDDLSSYIAAYFIGCSF